MNNTLLKLAAPLLAAFTLASCAHRPVRPATLPRGPDLHQAAMQAAVTLSSANDFQMVTGCSGDNGRGGTLSYSESTDQYRLQLVTGEKVEVITAKETKEGEAFGKLNDHCYPKPQ